MQITVSIRLAGPDRAAEMFTATFSTLPSGPVQRNRWLPGHRVGKAAMAATGFHRKIAFDILGSAGNRHFPIHARTSGRPGAARPIRDD